MQRTFYNATHEPPAQPKPFAQNYIKAHVSTLENLRQRTNDSISTMHLSKMWSFYD
ncbi:MAG: hypothetical protein IPM91_15475 [Bacteroidetes bacterium]|nr:hypothetical protein [Bacteroidota bacterium]